jgi:hypothetical protein
MPDTTEIWMKNGKSKVVLGNQTFIVDGTHQISFSTKDPKKEYTLMAIPPQAKPGSIEKQLSLYTQLPFMKKAKKTGTAKVLGHAATIYQVPQGTPGTPGAMKVWVTNDLGAPLPLRLEATTPMGKMTQEITLLEIDKSVPDSVFKAPSGYKKVTVSNHPPMPPVGNGPKK